MNDKITVLVTGGYGFIGSNFIRYLTNYRSDWRIINFDKLTYAAKIVNLSDISKNDYKFVEGDLQDEVLVDEVFNKENPDYVVHIAGASHVTKSIIDPSNFLENNIIATHSLLKAVAKYKIKNFLYISTDEVYGDHGEYKSPSNENSALRPSTPYAWSKASADMLVQIYHRTYNVPTIIVRPCNQFGPRQFHEKFIPLMIKNMFQRNKLTLHGNGQHIRTWLFVEDLANALLSVLELGKIGEIYNIASLDKYRNIDVLEYIINMVSGYENCDVKELFNLIEYIEDRPGNDQKYIINDNKIRRELDWQPTVSFFRGLESTVKWYHNNRNMLGI